MKYYHGSQNQNLQELSTKHGLDKFVYMTSDYATAVFYAGCTLRFWAWDKEKDILIVRELGPNGLEYFFKDVPICVYTADEKEVGDFEVEVYHGRPAIKIDHNVKLNHKEIFPSALTKLYELHQLGKIKIERWEDITAEQQYYLYNQAKNMLILMDENEYPEEFEMLSLSIKEIEEELTKKL